MAQPDRETVYAALQTLLQGLLTTASPAGPFVTVTRRFATVSNTPAANMPALTQVQFKEHSLTVKGLPTVHTYTVHLLIYCDYGASKTAVPDTTLNGLVTAVEGALAPNPVNLFQQLGVPVSSVVVNGEIEYANMAGTSGVWGMALIPLEIVANF